MTAPTEPIVVVGGGPGGHACVEAYRDAGGDRPIVLVSNDDRLPYDRPALTKEFLRGEVAGVSLPLEAEAWYQERDVAVLLATEATMLDPAQRTIRLGDRVVSWSAVVLATGSVPATLPVPGADDPGVLSIRWARDTERARAAIDARPGPVVVVGSGFIGCEAAASLRALGGDVTIVSQEELPQIGRLGHDVGAVLAGWLRDAGVETRYSSELQHLERSADGSWRVHLRSGGLDAAHVLVAVGARPQIALAQDAGLPIDGGVIVDASMRSTVPDVLAVGDVAAAWHPVADRRLRVEHWGDALAMGAVAGHTLAGRADQWSGVPGFWSTFAGRTIKHAAWGDGWDEIRWEGGPDGFAVWYGRQGQLVGVLTCDRDETYDEGQGLVAARSPLPTRGTPAR